MRRNLYDMCSLFLLLLLLLLRSRRCSMLAVVVGRFSHEFHASVICTWSFDDFEICLNKYVLIALPSPHWEETSKERTSTQTLNCSAIISVRCSTTKFFFFILFWLGTKFCRFSLWVWHIPYLCLTTLKWKNMSREKKKEYKTLKQTKCKCWHRICAWSESRTWHRSHSTHE